VGALQRTPPENMSAGMREHVTLRPKIVDAVRRMVQLGVPISTGTDAGVSWTPFDSLAVEMEILVNEVGMTPLQAIQAATANPARALGLADTLGTIAVGRTADLIVVDGDPTVDIG